MTTIVSVYAKYTTTAIIVALQQLQTYDYVALERPIRFLAKP